MIENCLDIELDAHYIKSNLQKLMYTPKSVKCMEYVVKPCQTYQQFCDLHSEFLDVFPDFRLDEDRFDDMMLNVTKQKAKQQLEGSVIGVIQMIVTNQIPEQYLAGTIGGVLEDLLAEENIEDIKQFPFTNIVALWAIAQFE